MPNKQANVIADLEQLEQSVIDIAKIIHSYYDQLVQSGLDHEFARELTRDFASNWWDRLLSGR